MKTNRHDDANGAQGLTVIDNTDRSPPASDAAEQHVLACCLLDAGATLARCQREKIVAKSFWNPVHATVFQTLVDLQTAGQPIVLEVLVEELQRRKTLEAIGGMPTLLRVTGGIPTTLHAGYFIEQLVEKWMLRKFITAGTEVIEEAYAFTGGIEEFTGRHALRLQRLADFVQRRLRAGQKEEAREAQAAADKILAGHVDKSRQLVLGLAHSDSVMLPFDVNNEDWFNVIAGPPSGGKSSLMRQIVGVNCRSEKRFAVFLLETGKRRWLWALAASLAQVDLRTMLEEPGRALKEKIELWKKWNAEVAGWMEERLWVFDDIYFFEDIERTVRELDRAERDRDLAAGVPPDKARGLDGIVVDYLQLMAIREKIRQREEQVAYMSKGMKRLLKSLNISGFIGAQLNRKPRDEERRPRLSDLRESGAIEQDADRVLLLHTPAEDRSGASQAGRDIVEVELIQAKSRNGPANIATNLVFFRRQTRFIDSTQKGDVRPGALKPAGGYKREGESS
jgi:replicative DNA helicase